MKFIELPKYECGGVIERGARKTIAAVFDRADKAHRCDHDMITNTQTMRMISLAEARELWLAPTDLADHQPYELRRLPRGPFVFVLVRARAQKYIRVTLWGIP